MIITDTARSDWCVILSTTADTVLSSQMIYLCCYYIQTKPWAQMQFSLWLLQGSIKHLSLTAENKLQQCFRDLQDFLKEILGVPSKKRSKLFFIRIHSSSNSDRMRDYCILGSVFQTLFRNETSTTKTYQTAYELLHYISMALAIVMHATDSITEIFRTSTANYLDMFTKCSYKKYCTVLSPHLQLHSVFYIHLNMHLHVCTVPL